MSLLKAIQKSLWLPVDITRDVLTLGGVCTGDAKLKTIERIKKIEEEIDE